MNNDARTFQSENYMFVFMIVKTTSKITVCQQKNIIELGTVEFIPILGLHIESITKA